MSENETSHIKDNVVTGFSAKSDALVDNVIREYMKAELIPDLSEQIEKGSTYEGGFSGMIKDPRFFHYTSTIRQSAEELHRSGKMTAEEKDKTIDAYRMVTKQKLDLLLDSLKSKLDNPNDFELYHQLFLARRLLDVDTDSPENKIK
jgi:hypothetical protein